MVGNADSLHRALCCTPQASDASTPRFSVFHGVHRTIPTAKSTFRTSPCLFKAYTPPAAKARKHTCQPPLSSVRNGYRTRCANTVDQRLQIAVIRRDSLSQIGMSRWHIGTGNHPALHKLCRFPQHIALPHFSIGGDQRRIFRQNAG